MNLDSGTERTEQLIIIAPREVQAALELAAQEGVEMQVLDDSGLEPVTTVTLLLIGSSLAVGVVVYLLDKRKGGQVVDVQRGAPKLMYRSPDVQYGLVVIFAKDGKVTVDVKEPKQMFGQVLDSITSILSDIAKGGAEAIAAAAKAAVGNAANVQVEPIAAHT